MTYLPGAIQTLWLHFQGALIFSVFIWTFLQLMSLKSCNRRSRLPPIIRMKKYLIRWFYEHEKCLVVACTVDRIAIIMMDPSSIGFHQDHNCKLLNESYRKTDAGFMLASLASRQTKPNKILRYSYVHKMSASVLSSCHFLFGKLKEGLAICG